MYDPNINGLGNLIHISTLNGTGVFTLVFTTHSEDPTTKFQDKSLVTQKRDNTTMFFGYRSTLRVDTELPDTLRLSETVGHYLYITLYKNDRIR